VTLFVNHESRSETLLDYLDITTFLPTEGKSVYLSRRRDTLSLGPLDGFVDAHNFARILRKDPVYIMEQLSQIQLLTLVLRWRLLDELRQLLLVDRGMKDFRHPFHHYSPECKWDGDESEVEGGALAKFHGLKKLYIATGNRWRRVSSRPWNDDEIEAVKEVLTQFFQKERQKFPKCKIPEIIAIK
jgi:hypothetical protein